MNGTEEQLNREIKEMHQRMTDPEEQIKEEIKQKEKDYTENIKHKYLYD